MGKLIGLLKSADGHSGQQLPLNLWVTPRKYWGLLGVWLLMLGGAVTGPKQAFAQSMAQAHRKSSIQATSIQANSRAAPSISAMIKAPSTGQATDPLTNQLNDLEAIRAQYGIPGMGYASIQSGATPQTTIVVDGFRKKHTRALIDENDAFHIGSVTKSMTAVLIGMAVSDGLIRYDDTLEQLFPQLTIHPSLRNVRLKALLLHEAGIGTIDRISREMSPSQIATWEKIERAQMDVVQARLWVSQAFLARPKKVSPRNVYSNVGYMVLGHLLEQLYQKPWETLVSEKLFSPIGMNHCGFGPTSLEGDPDQSPSTIWGHYFESDIYNPVHYDNPPVYGPAGTVHCSLGDLAKYVSFQMDLYHGRSTIVSPVVAQGLFAAANAEGDTLGSWVRMPDLTTPLLSFKGSNQLNMAFVYLVPDRDRAMIVTLNAGDDNADAAAEAAVPLAAQAFSKF